MSMSRLTDVVSVAKASSDQRETSTIVVGSSGECSCMGRLVRPESRTANG